MTQGFRAGVFCGAIITVVFSVLTFLFTTPFVKPIPTEFTIAIVTDLDKNSKMEGLDTWRSVFQTLVITRNGTSNFIFETINKTNLVSDQSRKGRGMELSELIKFDNNLFALCDVTGIIYKLNQTDYSMRTKTILTFPNTDIPFKYEWATEYKEDLYLGSIGKEWVVNGSLIHQHAQNVAIVSKSGFVTYADWKDYYDKIRKYVNCSFPGYLQHEAVIWNQSIRRWMFLPRKASSGVPYDEVTDELHGTNMLIITDTSFNPVKKIEFGPLEPEWGFTSFRPLPHTDFYVALKVREVKGETESKIGIFDSNGKLYQWHSLGKDKYEGLEVLGFK